MKRSKPNAAAKPKLALRNPALPTPGLPAPGLRNPARLMFSGSVIVLVAALLATVYCSRMLMASMHRLDQSEKSLSFFDQAAAKSIENEFQRQDELLLLLARYPKPRREWSYLLHEFDVSLVDFLENQRHHHVLPFHVAKAHLNHAQIQFLRGENRGAIESLRQSIALASPLGDRTLTGKARNTLGCLYATLGDFESAGAVLRESHRDLADSKEQGISLATALRNLGLIERMLGRDGTEPIRDAIGNLEQAGEGNPFCIERELLQDFRMTLCEMYWAQGKLDQAIELSQKTQDDLRMSMSQIDGANLGMTQLSRNRYVNALRCTERNRSALLEIAAQAKNSPHRAVLGQTESSWQWHRLCDLTTELVSNDLLMTGTLVGEFEQQTGLVMAWGMYGWSHDVIVEMARNIFDRTQVVILADNGDSLQEAQSALKDAGVPLDSIQFRVEDYENPWLRDPGPIVSKSSSGVPIWFDSRLTRPGIYGRTVLDALPRLLQRDWNARIADLPIHVEGGMMLSNGQGLVVASRAIIDSNLAYGFSEESIIRDLRRATGAKQLLLVDPLVGEPTQHVDLFMTFVSPTTLVVAESVDPQGPNVSNLDRTAAKLSQVVVGGEKLRVVRIAMPEPGENRFPSYTNVVFANGVLLVPSYADQPKSLEAGVRSVYEELLGDWQVRLIDCSKLCDKGGSLHCLVSNLGHTKFAPMTSRGGKPLDSVPID